MRKYNCTNNHKRKHSEEWMLSKVLAKRNKRLTSINVLLTILLLLTVSLLLYEKFF